MRHLAIYMCVFDTKVAVGGWAGGSGCFAGGRRWRLRAGGDNGPAHAPASRGTHMHACMLGTTCMHGALLPAPLTLECPDRAHGRTASEDVRHSRASPLGTQMLFFFLHTCLHLPFLISGCIPSPSTVGLGALSLSLSLSLRVFASTRGNYHVTCGAITSMLLQESKLKHE